MHARRYRRKTCREWFSLDNFSGVAMYFTYYVAVLAFVIGFVTAALLAGVVDNWLFR